MDISKLVKIVFNQVHRDGVCTCDLKVVIAVLSAAAKCGILKKPSNTKLKFDGLKSVAPCPCTAIKTGQCGEWCFYYPPTT